MLLDHDARKSNASHLCVLLLGHHQTLRGVVQLGRGLDDPCSTMHRDQWLSALLTEVNVALRWVPMLCRTATIATLIPVSSRIQCHTVNVAPAF